MASRHLADRAVEHTLVGDPLGDAAVVARDGFDRMEAHRLVGVCMNQDDDVLQTAQRAVQDFFTAVGVAPEWVGPEAMAPSWHDFHDNVYELVLAVVAGSVAG